MTKEKFKCRFCSKSFVREKSLFVHSCVYKTRWNEKEEKASQIGYIAWKKFFTLNSFHHKCNFTFIDFTRSKYYNGFYKFGKFVADSNVYNSMDYLKYLMKNSIKLDHWTKESIYTTFLTKRLNNEKPLAAIIRTIEYIEKWAEKEDQDMSNFLIKVNPNLFVREIRQGKISPWIMFISEKADQLTERLDESHSKILNNLIDSKAWSIKSLRYKKEINEIKIILKEYDL